jgi:hypothetical protein
MNKFYKLAVAASLSFALPVLADEISSESVISSGAAQENYYSEYSTTGLSAGEGEEWRFNTNFYFWLPELPIGTATPVGVQHILVSQSDVINSLQVGGMLFLEVSKGNWSVYLDSFALKLEGERSIFEQDLVESKITNKAIYYEPGVAYDLGTFNLSDSPDSATVNVKSFIGLRGLVTKFWLKNYGGDNLPEGAPVGPGFFFGKKKAKISFAAPVIGFRTLWSVNDSWSVVANGSYGGFGVDDLQESWQAEVGGQYRYKTDGGNLGKIHFGYRQLNIHFDDGRIDLWLNARGPYLGWGIEF